MRREVTQLSVPYEIPAAVVTDALHTNLRPELRCLWIGRNIPYPIDEGAKLYSAKLAESLVEAGCAMRFLGFGNNEVAPRLAPALEWITVPGERRRKLAGLFSLAPVAAAVDATAAYIALLDQQLHAAWDVIVLDGYAAGWALQRCMAYRASYSSPRPLLVHVSHNHEEVLWRSMARDSKGSLLTRIALWLNVYKVRALERRLVRNVDLLTAITAEDRQTLGAALPEDRSLALTPGYSGWVAEPRTITVDTPRRVIIVGSFRWVIKQDNLRRFVELADPLFKKHNIELDVVGEVPAELLAQLQSRCEVTHFHGFVTDVAPLFARARIAAVPEAIGGGFKLKLLDYIFARVPVATLSQAAAGLPQTLQQHMLVRDDLPALLLGMVEYIDRIADLNQLQHAAFRHAELDYRWEQRGQQLRQAITHARRPQHPTMHLAEVTQ